jgi:ABC-type uncharacterized transport system auxiliary subunit
MRAALTAIFLAAVLPASGCGGAAPPTNYYRLVPADCGPEAPDRADLAVLAVDELEVDSTYDDEQIVYRTSAYQLDRYYYHRWSAPPSRLVSDTLRLAYAASGRFAEVVPGPVDRAQVILRGRITALEEVDLTSERLVGRLELELRLEDATTGEILWSGRYAEEVPMRDRTPEALAQATSIALARIVEASTPAIAAAAARDPDAPTHPITCRVGSLHDS